MNDQWILFTLLLLGCTPDPKQKREPEPAVEESPTFLYFMLFDSPSSTVAPTSSTEIEAEPLQEEVQEPVEETTVDTESVDSSSDCSSGSED